MMNGCEKIPALAPIELLWKRWGMLRFVVIVFVTV
jgi:hypothetical protein